MGRVSVEVSDGRDRLDRLLDEGFRVEASGWKGARGTAVMSRAETHRFYADIAHWAAARGWLRLVFLRLDDRPLSFLFIVDCGGSYYLLKNGYDPAYRKFSPGRLVMHATIEHAVAAGRTVEFLGAEESYKLAWSSSCRDKRLLQAFAPTAPGFVDWAAVAYARPFAKRVLPRRPDPR
jgi:CelD/BcsL family acetyltransferase involved in cellulose biosynthesis